ncbi:MAG: TetR/AcrR family transcriptional regulator [Thermodesulfobacteriota bacterium]
MNSKNKGEFTREKILSRAIPLINAKGISNTSMNDIIESTGVKKGNLYFHFSSKEDLGLALIREAKQEYFRYINSRICGDTPLQQLDSILEAIVDFHASKGFIGGCIFGNTALEMGDSNDKFSTVIAEIFREWVSLMSGYIDEAKQFGELRLQFDSVQIARHIVAVLEGGVMMARLSKDKNDLLDCVKVLRSFLGISGRTSCHN